jgi:hypothetical protein
MNNGASGCYYPFTKGSAQPGDLMAAIKGCAGVDDGDKVFAIAAVGDVWPFVKFKHQ